jgi:hypothetical protein
VEELCHGVLASDGRKVYGRKERLALGEFESLRCVALTGGCVLLAEGNGRRNAYEDRLDR